MVDVLGLLICIVVHAATENLTRQERAGAKLLLAKAAKQGLPRLEKVLADDGDSGKPMVDYVYQEYGWTFESVKRTELHRFEVLPKRWVVERSIGWLNNFRGLSKHYDYDPVTGETKILLVSVYYLSKRLTRTKPEMNIDDKINERLIQLVKKTSQTT